MIQKTNEKYMLKSKTQIATAVAILFHTIGLVGMFINKDFFVATTALNLLLMAGLLFYTQEKINLPFLIFVAFCFTIGLVVEIVGTSTGYIFGEYAYGKMLGISFRNVPLVIGVNWFIIMYCSGVTVYTILDKLSARVAITSTKSTSPLLKTLSIISDGALLAVFFDWIMEPAAIKLGYWKWLGDEEIPSFNYMSWYIISTIVMIVFSLLKFDKQNIFAVNLLMIMMMFFMLIRTFL
jgi:bisanhydrobacterioruberin hydratase